MIIRVEPMRKKTVAVFILSFIFVHLSQAQGPDAVVIVRQSTLNGFLDAVGPVSGKAPYRCPGIQGGIHLDRKERQDSA